MKQYIEYHKKLKQKTTRQKNRNTNRTNRKNTNKSVNTGEHVVADTLKKGPVVLPNDSRKLKQQIVWHDDAANHSSKPRPMGFSWIFFSGKSLDFQNGALPELTVRTYRNGWLENYIYSFLLGKLTIFRGDGC